MHRIESEWKAKGQHGNPGDHALDQAVLHTDDKTEFRFIVGVMDAIETTRRDVSLGTKVEKRPAFNITFAVN